MNCKICNSSSEKIFSKTVLKKHEVNYYQCGKCDFIQTSNPVWLDEAYQSAITSLDLGLASRNIYLVEQVAKLIDQHYSTSKIMLDFAGGYGLFVRLMRDKGYNFYRQDDYCENIFSSHFDLKDIQQTRFDIVTAFEVFEHFPNPLQGIDRLLSYSDTIICSTELIESTNDIENWWYISPETGQHIAFYSLKTLRFIAEKHQLHFYTNHQNLHLFTKKQLSEPYPFTPEKYVSRKTRLLNVLLGKDVQGTENKRSSLLQNDYEYIKGLLNKHEK